MWRRSAAIAPVSDSTRPPPSAGSAPNASIPASISRCSRSSAAPSVAPPSDPSRRRSRSPAYARPPRAARLAAAEDVEDRAAEERDGPVVPGAEPLEVRRSLNEPDDQPDEARHRRDPRRFPELPRRGRRGFANRENYAACFAATARSTTVASRRRTSPATSASSSLSTIESIRSASTAETTVSPSRS
jgi:hypothetical protein